MKLLQSTLIASTLVLTALATGTPAQADPGRFMVMRTAVNAPVGYVQFCRDNGWACPQEKYEPVVVRLSEARWQELIDINAEVNRRVRPMTDEELAKANVTVRRFRYNYHVTYGSEQYEQAMVEATLQRDGDALRLRISEMLPWFVYELRFEGLPLVGDVLVAQVHEPVDGPVPSRPTDQIQSSMSCSVF